MSAPDVKGSFAESGKGKLLAASLSAFLVLSPVEGFNNSAHAQQLQNASNASYIETSDASREAVRWTASDRKNISVIVIKGTQCLANREKVGSVLTEDFKKNNIEENRVKVFIQPGTQDYSAVQLVHDKLGSKYYDLSDGPNGVRSKIPDFAEKVRFDNSIGQTLAATHR